MPVCDPCARVLRNRPFPAWLRYAFAGLIVLALFSLARNARFFEAHVDSLHATRALREKRLDEAVRLMNSAARRVPESAELRASASVLGSIQLMQQERYAEATPLLRSALADLPGNPDVQSLLLSAEAGAAFDSKNYDLFLEKSLALAKAKPDDPIAVASVASAYACKYAKTGNEEFRQAAERGLEAAAGLAPRNDPSFKDYEARIRHRLETREIISPREYMLRFAKDDPKAAKP